MSEWNVKSVGVSRLVKAFGYSLCGFRFAFAEAAFRQELLLACVLVPTSFYLHVTKAERAVMVACVLLVLIVELLNAAVEAVVDKASPEWHELAKKAKDLASSAVLLALINMLVVWLLILVG